MMEEDHVIQIYILLLNSLVDAFHSIVCRQTIPVFRQVKEAPKADLFVEKACHGHAQHYLILAYFSIWMELNISCNHIISYIYIY